MGWYWAFWLLAFIALFAVGETYALMTGRATLSATVWRTAKAFPLLGVIFGAVFGGLAVHFFWGGAVCFATG